MAHEAITLALDLAKILHEVWLFSEVCKELHDRCLALLPILGDPSLNNNPAVDNLKRLLQECIDYLKGCQDDNIHKRLARGALEKLLLKKVPTFKERIQVWIATASLSVTVFPPPRVH